jgi:manganese/zinc/iron transport system permease protein
MTDLSAIWSLRVFASFTFNWQFDGWIILAGVLCAIASSLVGCFLVLRRMSMLGDAISHAVLPGLAAAFLITNSRSSFTMFIGAVLVGVLTALLTEWIRGYGKVDEGASMGVVFTVLFALGLLMIVQAADHVDLDASCVLYGSIEMTPFDTWTILGYEIPRVVVTLSIVAMLNAACVIILFKEFRIASFDPGLATATGFSARFMHYLLMVLVAVTAVASFESVGNILVLAMMVVPPATALMLTDRLHLVVIFSVCIGIFCAAVGHLSAVIVPAWFGARSVPTAGMIAATTGLVFTVVVLFAPSKGVVTKWLRRKRLSIRILQEDLLAFLYRIDEATPDQHVSKETLGQELRGGRLFTRLAVWRQARRGNISHSGDSVRLTEDGKRRAVELIRSHRLWESYLDDQNAVPSDKLHDRAHQLEHYTNRALREQLDAETSSPELDPHGRPIPAQQDPSP